MTLAQARRADPSLKVSRDETPGCVFASGQNAQGLVFNPARVGGRLAYITPRRSVSTAAGIGVGSTYTDVATAYRITSTVKNEFYPDPIGVDSSGVESDDARPSLRILFDTLGAETGDGARDITQSKVIALALDGGQTCFG